MPKRSSKRPSDAEATPEYRVEVKHRALPPTPWKWEIYIGEKPMWVKQSEETFKSRDAAYAAGSDALMKLERHK